MNRLLIPLVVAAIVGCGAPPPAPLDPPSGEARFRARSLSDAGLREYAQANSTGAPGSFPPPAWDLPALTLVAFYFHPDLDVARARVATAQAGMKTAGMWPNPTAGVDLEKVVNRSALPSPWVYGFNLTVPIDTLWKRGYRIEEAGHVREQALFDLGLAAWQVRSRLRAALADHLLAAQELDVKRAEVHVREEVAQAFRGRLAAGASFRLEVDRVEAELATAHAALEAAAGQVAETRSLLARALGVPLPALQGASFAWPELDKPPPADALPIAALQKTGLVNRLEVRRALAEYEAAESSLKLEIAKRYPDVALGPGFTNDQGDHKVTLGLSFTLPVLNQNEGPIAEAVARREEVAARFLSLQAGIIGETETALARYQYALRELAQTDQTIAALGSREKTARRAVELGAEDRVTLTGLQLETAVGSAARVAALRKVQSSLGDLENALQSPLGAAGTLPDLPPESPRDRSRKDQNP